MSRHKSKRYIDLPRSARQDAFVAKRWQIKQDKDNRGVFRSHHLIPGNVQWDQSDWRDHPNFHAEVQFVSVVHAKKGWWYHANFSSVSSAVICHVADLVDKRVEEKIEAAGYTFQDIIPHVSWDDFSESPYSILISSPYPKLERLGNKTMRDLERDEWEKISPEDYNHIQLGVQLNFAGRRAIDLVGVVEDRHLTVDTVIEAIHQFIDNGEQESQTPVVWADYEKDIAKAIHDQTLHLYSQPD